MTPNVRAVDIPSIVSKFLSYFYKAEIYQRIELKNNTAQAGKYLFSLKNFPCPQKLLNGSRHVHSNNRPYIIYSPVYKQQFHFIYVGCHCSEFCKRIPASLLLDIIFK